MSSKKIENCSKMGYNRFRYTMVNKGVVAMARIKGKSIFEGIVVGEPYLRTKKKLNIEEYTIDEDELEIELNRFKVALEETKNEIKFLKNSLKGKIDDDELKILKVHLMVLDDPVLLSEINKGISKRLINAEKVVEDVVQNYIEMFSQLKDPVYRQRAIDIKDIGNKLISHLLRENRELEDLDGKILLAREIFPSELLKAHHKGIKLEGIVTEYGGDTSHVAILAKSLEIPTLMGVKNILEKEWGEVVVLDTRKARSCIIVKPTSEEILDYRKAQDELNKKKEEYEKVRDLSGETKDGTKINLLVNVGGNLDINEISKQFVDGVGLLRSEFLYIDSEFFPSEEKQIKIYQKVYSELEGCCTSKSLTIRTLDVGADKKLDYYEMLDEENPSLGLRGLRFTLAHRDIFKEQLRAILRAAYDRNVKIMYPMVTNLKELEEANEILEEVKSDLKKEGLDYKDDIEVGIMIEVPSTVFLADKFAKKVDFFSIGTNDLTQYILAADRLSSEVGYLYDEYDPAVLRAINMVAEAGIRNNKKVSICGEMGGTPMAIIALLSLGIKDLSMLSSFIPRAKSIIRNLDMKALEGIKDKLLACGTSDEVREILKRYI